MRIEIKMYYFVILGMLVLCGGAIAEEVNIKITSSKSDLTENNLLLAEISGASIVATASLSGGMESHRNELEKCKVLAELIDTQPQGIMPEALSPLGLTIIFSESRASHNLREKWIAAVKATQVKWDVKMDLPAEGGFYPIVGSIDFVLKEGLVNRIRGIGRSVSFFKNVFENKVQKAINEQLESYNSSGIIRVALNDQASVCYSLLSGDVDFELEVKARAVDRIETVNSLNGACVSTVLAEANKKMSMAGYSRTHLNDKDFFYYLFGMAVGVTAMEGGGGYVLTQGDMPCRESGRSARENAVSTWSNIIDRRWEIYQQSSSLRLNARHLHDVSSLSSTVQYKPTTVKYTLGHKIKLGMIE
ncbi:MAG: hypothetical protein AB2809_20015 [Candidatus Thiodiazotropha sp.]